MVFNQGLGGPKVNPKGVADGQWVNIPTLGYFSKSRRRAVTLANNRILRFYTKEQSKVREKLVFNWQLERARCPEKNFQVKNIRTVPQTDTGGQA